MLVAVGTVGAEAAAALGFKFVVLFSAFGAHRFYTDISLNKATDVACWTQRSQVA